MFSDQRRNEECVTSLLHITINRYMNKEEIIFTIIVEHIRIRTRSKISILLLLLRINTNPKYFYQSYHLNRSELDTPTGLDLIITNCQRSQFLVALVIASASASAITKIRTLALAISASTISALQYLIQIHQIFMKIATGINSGGDLHIHRQVYHGWFAHLYTSFWTDRRYP